jgi:hypothetical protein
MLDLFSFKQAPEMAFLRKGGLFFREGYPSEDKISSIARKPKTHLAHNQPVMHRIVRWHNGCINRAYNPTSLQASPTQFATDDLS